MEDPFLASYALSTTALSRASSSSSSLASASPASSTHAEHGQATLAQQHAAGWNPLAAIASPSTSGSRRASQLPQQGSLGLLRTSSTASSSSTSLHQPLHASRASSYSAASQHASPARAHAASTMLARQVPSSTSDSPALRPLAHSLDVITAASHEATAAQADAFLTSYSMPRSARPPLAHTGTVAPLSLQPSGLQVSAAQQMRGFVRTDTQASMMAGMMASWGGGCEERLPAPAPAHLALPRTPSESAAASPRQPATGRGHHRTLTVVTDIKRRGREEDVVSVPVLHVPKRRSHQVDSAAPLPLLANASSSSATPIRSSGAASPELSSRLLSKTPPTEPGVSTAMSPNTVLRMLATAHSRGLPAHHSRASSFGGTSSGRHSPDLLDPSDLARSARPSLDDGDATAAGLHHSTSESAHLRHLPQATPLSGLSYHAPAGEVASPAAAAASVVASPAAAEAERPFDFTPASVRRLAEAYLRALSSHSAADLLTLFCGDEEAGDQGRARSGPSLHSASVRRRWGIADAHICGRLALRKHWEKGFDPAGSDDAHATAALLGVLAGPTPASWCVLYQRTDCCESQPAATHLVAEYWDLTQEGRIACVRVAHQEPPYTPIPLPLLPQSSDRANASRDSCEQGKT